MFVIVVVVVMAGAAEEEKVDFCLQTLVLKKEENGPIQRGCLNVLRFGTVDGTNEVVTVAQ